MTVFTNSASSVYVIVDALTTNKSATLLPLSLSLPGLQLETCFSVETTEWQQTLCIMRQSLGLHTSGLIMWLLKVIDSIGSYLCLYSKRGDLTLHTHSCCQEKWQLDYEGWEFISFHFIDSFQTVSSWLVYNSCLNQIAPGEIKLWHCIVLFWFFN